MKKRQELEEQAEERGEEKKKQESIERRKRLKKADRAARWSGFVLLLCILLIGFLMWIVGEIQEERNIYSSSVEIIQ